MLGLVVASAEDKEEMMQQSGRNANRLDSPGTISVGRNGEPNVLRGECSCLLFYV